LNDIWEIEESRTYWRKFSDYLALILICPLLLILSGSTTVFVTTQITLITEKVALLGKFSSFIFFMLKLLPYCLIWILFSFSYILIPNTRVRFSSGLWAGIIAGTSYQLAQWAYIYFQVGVANYNAIYGSFAALPLFLVWLKLSWLIVLFGAEISFAHQNVDAYEFEADCRGISRAFKNLISLQIAHLLIKNFSEGEKPLAADQISRTLEIPIRLVRRILVDLVDSGIISRAQTRQNTESTYQPALDINLLTIKYIIGALEHRGIESIPMAETTVSKKLLETLQTFSDAIEKSPANRLLKEI
jgi:membrane protein